MLRCGQVEEWLRKLQSRDRVKRCVPNKGFMRRLEARKLGWAYGGAGLWPCIKQVLGC